MPPAPPIQRQNPQFHVVDQHEFNDGQIDRHQRFDYHGMIFDNDPFFSNRWSTVGPPKYCPPPTGLEVTGRGSRTVDGLLLAIRSGRG
jgi:hypothetical protein